MQEPEPPCWQNSGLGLDKARRHEGERSDVTGFAQGGCSDWARITQMRWMIGCASATREVTSVAMTWELEAKARATHRLESSLSESRDSDCDGVSPVVDGSMRKFVV